MDHNCINLKGKLEYEMLILKEVPKKERVSFIEQYAEGMRRDYCLHLCPVGRFYRRYGEKR